MRSRLCPLVVLSLLTACAVAPAPEGADGSPFQERPVAESHLSYDSDRTPFRNLKVSTGRDRRTEAIEIDGGVLLYEERPATDGFTEANLDPAHVARWLDRNYRILENGFNFTADTLQERSNRHGRLVWALLSKADANCLVFRQGATNRQPFEVHSFPLMVSGHLCRPTPVDSRVVMREADALISRMVFDGGALNRATAQPVAPELKVAPVAVVHAIALAVAWAGEELWVGSGQLDTEGKLTPFILRRAESGVCRGQSDAPQNWTLDCDGGRSARGTFSQSMPGRGGGQGRDSNGRAVTLVFGP
jgi:hypothetical protein